MMRGTWFMDKGADWVLMRETISWNSGDTKAAMTAGAGAASGDAGDLVHGEGRGLGAAAGDDR